MPKTRCFVKKNQFVGRAERKNAKLSIFPGNRSLFKIVMNRCTDTNRTILFSTDYLTN